MTAALRRVAGTALRGLGVLLAAAVLGGLLLWLGALVAHSPPFSPATYWTVTAAGLLLVCWVLGDITAPRLREGLTRSQVKWPTGHPVPPPPPPGRRLDGRRCAPCGAPRPGASCHKCGAPTFWPAAGWVEPELPPVDAIRALARQVGYAVAVHGTLERDVDLIAAPWTDAAVASHELLAHLADGLGALVVGSEPKPLGRFAASLQLPGWVKPVDLSICPRGPQ